MFIGEPGRTQFDLHFEIAGIAVRVHPLFWLVTLIMGLLGSQGAQDPAALVIIWIIAVFVSILVHEFGHAFAMRYYGEGARVVLYSFGGLAIPDASPYSSGYGARRSPRNQILISAAGPAAGFVLAAIVLGVAYLSGAKITEGVLGGVIPFPYVGNLPSKFVKMLVDDLLFVNIMWGAINLLPIYPLDGGQISREVFMVNNPRAGLQQSLWLSVIAGGGMAVAGLVLFGELFIALLFGSLAFGSYQMLQQLTGRGGGFGGGGGGYGGGRPW